MRAWIMSDLHIDSGDAALFSSHPEVDVIIMAGGVDPVSPDRRRLGLGTKAQELAW
jgi:predicted phosphodiesterase